MNKLLKCLVMLSLIVGICSEVVYAATITLGDIANAFNTYSEIVQWNEMGASMVATANGNVLRVSSGDESFEAELEGNILVLEASGIEEAIFAMYIMDSVAVAQGYSEGEVAELLNSEELVNFTLENDGIEAAVDAYENMTGKIDLSKKMLTSYTGAEDNVIANTTGTTNFDSMISDNSTANEVNNGVVFIAIGGFLLVAYVIVIATKKD